MSGTIYKSYTMLTNPPDGFTVSIDPSSLTISQQALFAAPPPIGSTTPNTGAFTTLSATTPIKPASGGTGSNAIPGAGSLLIGNSSGSYTVNQLTAGSGINITNASGAITISGASTGSSFTRTTITATGGQTTFSVSYGVGSIQVYLNGVMLAPADYTATSGTSVVLAVAAAAGDIFDAFSFTPQNITGVVPQANGGTGVSNASLTPITATGSTTARTLGARASDTINIKDYGAVCDGTTDDTAAILLACAAVGPQGGEVIAPGKVYVGSNLALPAGVCLRGVFDLVGTTGSNTSINYASQSGIRLASSATISLAAGAGITGLLIYRYGMTFPAPNASSFAGVAVTMAGDDAFVDKCMILGFNKAVYCNGYQRPRIYNLWMDCTNGIEVTASTDIGYYDNCHAWPFSSVATGTDASAYRSGTAYYFHDQADFHRVTNCFAYYYQNCFTLNNVTEMSLLNCSTDAPSGVLGTTTCVGINIEGYGIRNHVIGGTNSNQYIGVYINNTNNVGNWCSIQNHSLTPSSTGTAFLVNYGFADISDCNIYGCNQGVGVANGNAYGAIIRNNNFDSVTTPINIAAPSINLSTIDGNSYQNCLNTLPNQISYNFEAPAQVWNAYGTTQGVTLKGYAAQGNGSNPTIVTANQILFGMTGGAYNGTSNYEVAKIRFQTGSTISSTSLPTTMVFSTTLASSTTVVDGVAINQGGVLFPLTDNAYSLGASGNRWSVVYAATGTINTSDQRQKTQISDASLGLEFINALHPVSYKWVSGGKVVTRQLYRDKDGKEVPVGTTGAKPAEIISSDSPGKRTHWGFLAQEVQTTIEKFGVDFAGWTLADPADPNSQQGLRYDQFIAPLVKAIQELSDEVEVLKAKVSS